MNHTFITVLIRIIDKSKQIDRYLKKQNIESKVVSSTQLYIQGLGELH